MPGFLTLTLWIFQACFSWEKKKKVVCSSLISPCQFPGATFQLSLQTITKVSLANLSLFAFCCFNKDHDQNQLDGEEFIWLSCPDQSPSFRGVGQEPEAKAMEEHCLLACYLWLDQLIVPYSSGPTCPKMLPPTVDRTLQHHSLIKIMSHKLSPRPVCWHFLNWGSFFQMTNLCPKLTKTNQDRSYVTKIPNWKLIIYSSSP